MDIKKIGVLAGLVGMVAHVVRTVPGILIAHWSDSGFEGPLPMIGRAGETVAIYGYLIDIVEVLVPIGLAIGLGYYIARRVNIATEYRRVTRALAVGSTVGVILVLLILLWLSIVFSGSEIGSIDAFSGFLLGAALVRSVLEVTLLITIGALAGAAFTHFRESESPPARPTEATADPSEDPATPTRSDDGSIDSRPAH